MPVFVLSDNNSSNDQVTALPFLLEDDAVDYYHSLTSARRLVSPDGSIGTTFQLYITRASVPV